MLVLVLLMQAREIHEVVLQVSQGMSSHGREQHYLSMHSPKAKNYRTVTYGQTLHKNKINTEEKKKKKKLAMDAKDFFGASS